MLFYVGGSGSAKERVECPECGTKMWKRRPPFRLGRPRSFACSGCDVKLRFSADSQKRLVYVVLAVIVLGIAAFLSNIYIGQMAGVVIAFLGTGVALGMLVWQGQVPQVEVAGDVMEPAEQGVELDPGNTGKGSDQ